MSRRKKAELTRPVTLVYVGPTIRQVVKSNTVMTNGISTALSEAVAKNPFLNNLLVPVENLPEALKDIAIKKGFYWESYKKALQEGV